MEEIGSKLTKVLFLDIDGVLNCSTTKEKFEEGIYKHFISLDKKRLKLFLGWLEDKDIQIVLSSSWRGSEFLRNFLKDNGVNFVAYTNHDYTRSIEISKFVSDHAIEKYAILDDMDFGWNAEQRARFVQTSYMHGLRKKNLKRLDKILE